MTIFTKININSNEYNILKYIRDKKLNLTPYIFDLQNDKVIYECYDMTLNKYMLSHNIKNIHELSENDKNNIYHLINMLHNNNILHGDLHIDNIVIKIDDLYNNIIDVKLIDFEYSMFVSLLNQQHIDFYNIFWNQNIKNNKNNINGTSLNITKGNILFNEKIYLELC